MDEPTDNIPTLRRLLATDPDPDVRALRRRQEWRELQKRLKRENAPPPSPEALAAAGRERERQKAQLTVVSGQWSVTRNPKRSRNVSASKGVHWPLITDH
jgi:hypothetical protein